MQPQDTIGKERSRAMKNWIKLMKAYVDVNSSYYLDFDIGEMRKKLLEARKRTRLLEINGRWRRMTTGVLKLHSARQNRKWVNLVKGLAHKHPGTISFKML